MQNHPAKTHRSVQCTPPKNNQKLIDGSNRKKKTKKKNKKTSKKLDTDYPHDGRADNAAYRHDRRADKRRYPHDRKIDYQMLKMFKNGYILGL